MFEAHFQTFEEPESGVALTARLSAFREVTLRAGERAALDVALRPDLDSAGGP